MSFNLDDPLAGILSDGSDDSFFDDDILGKKKPAKKKDLTLTGKKNALFDLDETDKSKTASVLESKKEALFEIGADAKKNLTDKIEVRASPAPLKRTVSKDSFQVSQTESRSKPFDVIKSPAKPPKVSASTDKIDILSEFGSELKSLGKGKSSSQSILDDILGGSSTKPGSSQATRPPTAPKSQEFDFDSFLGKPADSKPPPKTAPQKSSAKFETLKEATMKDDPKKKAGGDWLGIFQEDDAASAEDNAEMPSWLVGGDTKKKKTDEKKVIKPEPVREQPKIETAPQEIQEVQQEINKAPADDVTPKLALLNVPSVLQGSSEDITAEGAALYLQQQDSQLMVAMQLKAQEERLAAMQGKYFRRTTKQRKYYRSK